VQSGSSLPRLATAPQGRFCRGGASRWNLVAISLAPLFAVESRIKTAKGGLLRAATLLIAIVLCLVPLAGIVWIIVAGSITTVDGLFMSLILLSLSGVSFLNVFWEMRDRGLLSFLHKEKTVAGKEPLAPKAR
jgi:hypothetical protein